MFAQKTRWLFAGRVGGCAGRGYLCVAMEPTQVDNRSNDCGGRAEAARRRGGGERVASGSGWTCHSFCICPSPGPEVLIGPSYAGSKFRAVFSCELAAQPPRMKHQGMCHLSSRPTVTTLFTPLRIKPQNRFCFQQPCEGHKPTING